MAHESGTSSVLVALVEGIANSKARLARKVSLLHLMIDAGGAALDDD